MADVSSPELLDIDQHSGNYFWELGFCNPPRSADFWLLCRAIADLRPERKAFGEFWDDPDLLRGHNIVERRDPAGTFELVQAPSSTEYLHKVVVPFIVGESVMVSHALLVASSLNAVPFTDQAVHHNFLTAKMASALTDKAPKSRSMVMHSLGIEIFSAVVGEAPHKTAYDILHQRERYRDELSRLRKHLRSLVTHVNSEIWDEELAREIDNLVEGVVKPEIQELKDRMKELRERKVASFIGDVSKLAPLSVAATVFPGVPVELSLALAGGSLALKEGVSYLQESKNLRRNGLSFLLRLGE